MSEIVNNSFSVGEIFKGNVNNSIFKVVSVKKTTTTKGSKQADEILVNFQDVKTGFISEKNLKTAQRLLITKICCEVD